MLIKYRYDYAIVYHSAHLSRAEEKEIERRIKSEYPLSMVFFRFVRE